METNLFNIPQIERLETIELAKILKGWFTREGGIYFEHGFVADFYILNIQFKMTYVDDMGLHLVNQLFKNPTHLSWDKMSRKDIFSVMDACNAYYKYCKEVA